MEEWRAAAAVGTLSVTCTCRSQCCPANQREYTKIFLLGHDYGNNPEIPPKMLIASMGDIVSLLILVLNCRQPNGNASAIGDARRNSVRINCNA